MSRRLFVLGEWDGAVELALGVGLEAGDPEHLLGGVVVEDGLVGLLEVLLGAQGHVVDSEQDGALFHSLGGEQASLLQVYDLKAGADVEFLLLGVGEGLELGTE